MEGVLFPRTRFDVISVQVVAFDIHPEMTMENSIDVNHGHDHEHKHLPQ